MDGSHDYGYYIIGFIAAAIAFYAYTQIGSGFFRAVTPDSKEDREGNVFRIVLLCFILCALIVVLWFEFRLNYSISNNISDWGALGDFIGGIMNPIISLAILFFVLQAYVTQRKELKETVTQLESAAKSQEANAKMLAKQAELEIAISKYAHWSKSIEAEKNFIAAALDVNPNRLVNDGTDEGLRDHYIAKKRENISRLNGQLTDIEDILVGTQSKMDVLANSKKIS